MRVVLVRTDSRVGMTPRCPLEVEREFFIDNLLVRIHFITEMIGWTGLAPGGLTSTFLALELCTRRCKPHGKREMFLTTNTAAMCTPVCMLQLPD